MKKIFTFLCICLLFGQILYAQDNGLSTELMPLSSSRSWSIIRQQITARAANSNMKTTNGSGERLVSYRASHPPFVYGDSLALSWSGTRDLVHYKNPFDIISDIHDYWSQYVIPMDYNTYSAATSRYTTLTADSIVEYKIDFSGYILRTYKHNYGYNPGDNMTYQETITQDTGTDGGTYYDYQYNASGTIKQIEYFSDDTYDSVNNYLYAYGLYCTYDANDLLVEDSIIYNGYTFLNFYEKDAAGKDTLLRMFQKNTNPPSLLEFANFQFAYNNSGQLITSTHYSIDPQGMQTFSYADSFDYSSGQAYPVFYANRGFIPGLVTTERQHYYTLNNNGDVEYEVQLTHNPNTLAWDTTYFITTYYNANFNADSIGYDIRTIAGDLHRSYLQTFYYEPTPVATATGNTLIPAESALTLFPNPASETMTLKLPEATGQGAVSIYDAAGRLVRQYSRAHNGMQIDVTHLPIGTYTLRYTGAGSRQGAVQFIKS